MMAPRTRTEFVKMTNRAVFIDRDGTINEEVCYLNRPEQLALIPGSGEAIRRLNQAGLKVVIITNQSGVARGKLDELQLEKIHGTLELLLNREGAHFDALYYCPHHPDGTIKEYSHPCSCRKPETGMTDKAAREHNLTMTESYVIGDKYIETLLAHRIGAKGILVRTGHGEDEVKKYQNSGKKEPEFLAVDLLDAVQWLLKEMGEIKNG